MNRASDDVIDEERDSTDAQRFACELADFLRPKVMDKKIAANQVEGVVRKRKSKGIA